MATIVVTGATGFIGRRLVPLLIGRGHAVGTAGRRPAHARARHAEVGTIGGGTDWREALNGADAVVHLAGIAHRDDGSGDDAVYFEVNDRGTAKLAADAAAGGVRCVVHVSSIFARHAQERPSAYARSKLASEAHVRSFGEATGTGIVLRPTLVYAHDAPANWRALQRLAATGWPLPFGAIRNRRSFCARENLCDAIGAAVEAGVEGRGGGLYEIADREVVSLPQVLGYLRRGMGMSPRLFSVPPALLKTAGMLVGRRELVATLLSDLTADPGPFMEAFGWRPPLRAEAAMAESGRRFVGKD